MEREHKEREKRLAGRSIVVGICACGSPSEPFDLLRALRREGASVEILMTPNATQLISPLMLQRESDKPVLFEQFELPRSFDKDHRRKPDLMLIAPASANTVSKVALGLADNLLTTRAMSARCPVAFVLRCNPFMYEKKSLQRNIEVLKEDGYVFIQDPEKPSRFPPLPQLIDAVVVLLAQQKPEEGGDRGGRFDF